MKLARRNFLAAGLAMIASPVIAEKRMPGQAYQLYWHIQRMDSGWVATPEPLRPDGQYVAFRYDPDLKEDILVFNNLIYFSSAGTRNKRFHRRGWTELWFPFDGKWSAPVAFDDLKTGIYLHAEFDPNHVMRTVSLNTVVVEEGTTTTGRTATLFHAPELPLRQDIDKET
jgi:hypothetical protein